ncbi:DUF4920 domain-containing protein [Robertkochia solimangrovi]|uniref:DUF4920 domain-containing protein n=1 Tax=Robertkochia solimangrovi TaxID=2213046 RepID=UPI00117C8613|nr:DUF4920 domain-containing protein [Robertkochia solimangrovi]TRZ43725.1 DUF4920 domain-containing protein [Robertkochia solimangrovi]
MNKLTLIMAFLLLISAGCKTEKKEVSENTEQQSEFFGAQFEANDPADHAALMTEYTELQVGDTLNLTATAKVNAVCQTRGCWMKVDLGNGEEAMVKFKDYAFFMPKDLAGKEVVMNGKAYIQEMSVEDQQHYAEDAGKSEEEVLAITEVKKTYAFLADGVKIKAE